VDLKLESKAARVRKALDQGKELKFKKVKTGTSISS